MIWSLKGFLKLFLRIMGNKSEQMKKNDCESFIKDLNG